MNASNTKEYPYSHFRSETAIYIGGLVWKICPPFLLLVGSIGNILSIIVLSRRQFTGKTIAIYLIALAVSDLSMLYIGLFKLWIEHITNIKIGMLSVGLCKLDKYLSLANSHISTWLLTSVTVERCASTVALTRNRAVCRTLRTGVVVGGIVAFALATNIHMLIGVGNREITIGNDTMTLFCVPITDDYFAFLVKFWQYVEFITMFILPVIILSVGNSYILCTAYRASRNARRQITPSGQGEGIPAHKKIVLIAKQLTLLNCVFIICNLPIGVYYLGLEKWVPSDIPQKVRDDDPFFVAACLLFFTNHAANFLLYCVSGTLFRETLKQLFNKLRSTNSSQ